MTQPEPLPTPEPAAYAGQAAVYGDVHVDLPQDLTAPGAARSIARAALGRWAMALLVEPVALVVSELVTNAVRYGRPPVWMRLHRTEHGVCISVHDEAPGATPVGGEQVPSDAESGRGLAIVRALAADSGSSSVDGDGKLVWAQVEADPAIPLDQEPA